MRWFWICVGLSALAACSHEEAPSTDVGSQSQAVVAAAKPAPSSEGRALPSAGVPPAVSPAHCKPLSPDDERVSAESARRAQDRTPQQRAFDGHEHDADDQRTRDARQGLKDAYRRERESEELRLPETSEAHAKRAALAVQALREEAEFRAALAREQHALDTKPDPARQEAYATLKDRLVGGKK